MSCWDLQYVITLVASLTVTLVQGKVDSWWLHMAMVRRDSQRKGIATTLIDLVREKVLRYLPL